MAIAGMDAYPAMSGQNSKTQETSIGALTARLDSLRGALIENSVRLGQIGDRAFGSQAEVNPTGAPRQVPSGALGTLIEKVEDLEGAVAHQRSIVSRLESLV